MRLLQTAFLVWAAVWVGLAAAIAYELYALRDLSGTVVKTGTAVATTGQALHALGSLPLVGGGLGSLGDQVRAAGESAVATGHSSRGTTTDLAILIGIAIALIPSVPVLAVYVPLRRAWRAERRSLARALAELRDDPLLEQYLARRALETLPFHRLRAITAEPWADVAAGRYRDLADAELARLGLRRSPG